MLELSGLRTIHSKRLLPIFLFNVELISQDEVPLLLLKLGNVCLEALGHQA